MVSKEVELLTINNAVLHNQIKQLQVQLESEKVSHAAWEKQSLLEYSEAVQERDALRDALERIATPKRADGTYNLCREACEALARQTLTHNAVDKAMKGKSNG